MALVVGSTEATGTAAQTGGSAWTAWYATASERSRSEGRTGTRQGTGIGDLGPDAFFRLLAAQLQYQNPLEPMKDTEFIAQLAQFTALDETRAMRETLARFAALSLLGRTVRVTTAAGETKGTVTGVYLDQGEPALAIDGTRIPWAEIVSLLLEEATVPAGGEAGAAGQER
ncbi:MAG: flagellar hook capping protein [Symbiobacteriaceae bacterium]|nr:MAG: flagellar hook capping protein [Bacillota bacterium]